MTGRVSYVWTPDKLDQLRAMAVAGMRKREAADAMGVSFSVITKVAGRHGIQFRGKADQSGQSRKFNDYRMERGRAAAARAKRENRSIVPEADGAAADDIARFIAERGVTRCPTAFAAPSEQGALTASEARTRLRKLQLREDVVPLKAQSMGGKYWRRAKPIGAPAL